MESALRVTDRRSGVFALMLGAAVLLFAFVAGAALLPVAPCPVCPPDIFTITTGIAPDAPIMDAHALTCWCGGSGKVSLLDRWRLRRWRSTLVY